MAGLPFHTENLPLPEGPGLGPTVERSEPPPTPNPAQACRAALDHPVGRPPLSQWVGRGERVAVIVPDLTRRLAPELLAAAVAQIRAAGATPFARVANGTHRRMSSGELAERVPPELGIDVGDRDCDDHGAHSTLGITPSGIEVHLDSEAVGADRLVLLGPVSFHYLAGFGGGLKLLAPGLSDRSTAQAIHRRCMGSTSARHAEARLGAFPHANPLHQAIAEVAPLAPPLFAAVTQQDARGRLVGVFAGEPALAHHHACLALEGHGVIHTPPLRSVIVSAGGFPFDRDLIQAHKALESVSGVLELGARVVWVAAMGEGIPQRMRRWIGRSASDLEAELRRSFDINGYTLFALRSKAERFGIRAVTNLPEADCVALGLTRASSLEAAIRWAGEVGPTPTVPWGARFVLETHPPG